MNSAQSQQGFALLLAIIVASVLLAIGLSMLSITTKQLTLSSIARESEIAFQAAVAGMECIRFHRRQNPTDDYTTEDSDAPAIECFAETDTGGDSQSSVLYSGSDGFVNEFNYRLSWGSGGQARCSELDLYVMVAGTADISHTFNLPAVDGSAGSKTCQATDVCTVAVTRGYNKSCTDVDAGLATVQRELTAEF